MENKKFKVLFSKEKFKKVMEDSYPKTAPLELKETHRKMVADSCKGWVEELDGQEVYFTRNNDSVGYIGDVKISRSWCVEVAPININKNKETVSLRELEEIAKVFPKMTVKEFLELKRKYN